MWLTKIAEHEVKVEDKLTDDKIQSILVVLHRVWNKPCGGGLAKFTTQFSISIMLMGEIPGNEWKKEIFPLVHMNFSKNTILHPLRLVRPGGAWLSWAV